MPDQTIYPPIAFPARFHHFVRLEIAEVLRNLHLRFTQYVLEVADAQWTLRQQLQDTQPGGVAQAFVDPNEFHANEGADGFTYFKRNIVV